MKTTPEEVLSFWFGEVTSNPSKMSAQQNLWFKKSDETDATIKERFEPVLMKMSHGLSDQWCAMGEFGRLAAVIVLDQFPRNIFREKPESFGWDAAARARTKEGMAEGVDRFFHVLEKWFFYMPLMHSEDLVDQEQSVSIYRDLAEAAEAPFKTYLESVHDYAVRHAEIIQRFGRYPHRNEILGRVSTTEEIEFLKQPGSGF